MHENKRLKKENGDLNSELTSMKLKCKELLELVAKHSSNEEQRAEDDEDDKANNDEGLKLFGVSLVVKGEYSGVKKRMLNGQASAVIRDQSATILLSQSCK